MWQLFCINLRVDFLLCNDTLKAAASWQWWNYLVDSVPANRTPLRINMDETYVPLETDTHQGNVFLKKMNHKFGKGNFARRKVFRSKRRQGFTHVAFICDDPEIQKKLPQILIGRPCVFPKKLLPAFNNAVRPNLMILQATKGFNTAAQMVYIIKILAKFLKDYLKTHQIILKVDAAQSHCTYEVWHAFRAWRIWAILVPASTTWLLQVLDAYGFANYKNGLRALLVFARSKSPTGTVDITNFVHIVDEVIDYFLNNTLWADKFDALGYGLKETAQTKVRKFVCDNLEIAEPPLVPRGEPDIAEWWQLFPRNRHPPYQVLLPTSASRRRRAVLPALAMAVDPVLPPPVPVAPEVAHPAALPAPSAGDSQASPATHQPGSFIEETQNAFAEDGVLRPWDHRGP